MVRHSKAIAVSAQEMVSNHHFLHLMFHMLRYIINIYLWTLVSNFTLYTFILSHRSLNQWVLRRIWAVWPLRSLQTTVSLQFRDVWLLLLLNQRRWPTYRCMVTLSLSQTHADPCVCLVILDRVPDKDTSAGTGARLYYARSEGWSAADQSLWFVHKERTYWVCTCCHRKGVKMKNLLN